jgi:hypothetical protein
MAGGRREDLILLARPVSMQSGRWAMNPMIHHRGKPRGWRRPIKERFEEKVEKSDECWPWVGCLTPKGYGQINSGGRGSPVAVHRLAYFLLFGPIPKGMLVLHRCDNPACVRPDHLFLGTAQDNSSDMVRKGRARGIRGNHPKAKLREEQVIEIRRRYALGNVSMRGLAKIFGVGSDQICRIVNRKKWAWLEP